ncbi:MAG: polyprenyl synthetase family protein [Candidatus Paracaedibacteraceae bacterium]|nr:polyprenyl synthetase family protein [Candidatus Paracaedibacteraceae bacterium]
MSIAASECLTTNPLLELADLFADKIVQVDQLLKKRAYSVIPALPLVSSHIIESGGKRIRPLLTLAAARLCGYTEGDRDIRLAACIEFLHTATLLHDDVIDESPLRRGKPTAQHIWGNQMSILTGDFLFAKLFELLVEDGALDVLKLMVEASQKIIEGEVLQLGTKAKSFVSKEDYFTIIEAKTAVLFGAALELGALAANASSEQINALRVYAHNIGMAFQLIDDMLDYTADEPVLGKQIGNDFFEGQVTLPIIILYEKIETNPKLLEKLTAVITNLDRSKVDFQWVRGLLIQANVFSVIEKNAYNFAEQAREALSVFKNSSLKKTLIDLTYFVVNRCN